MHSNNTKRAQLRQELDNSQALADCARQCGVIGSLTTLKICYLLKAHPELSVTDIAQLVGTSVSNASHSLAKLKANELVTARRQSQTIFYSLNPQAFGGILTVLG